MCVLNTQEGHDGPESHTRKKHLQCISNELAERQIQLNSNLKVAIKLIRANLIKDYLRMLQTKFGDHPSISSAEEVVKDFDFLFC
jgi:hypothetical protein